jgi:hypothetical protein
MFSELLPTVCHVTDTCGVKLFKSSSHAHFYFMDGVSLSATSVLKLLIALTGFLHPSLIQLPLQALPPPHLLPQ